MSGCIRGSGVRAYILRVVGCGGARFGAGLFIECAYFETACTPTHRLVSTQAYASSRRRRRSRPIRALQKLFSPNPLEDKLARRPNSMNQCGPVRQEQRAWSAMIVTTNPHIHSVGGKISAHVVAKKPRQRGVVSKYKSVPLECHQQAHGSHFHVSCFHEHPGAFQRVVFHLQKELQHS